MMESRETVRFAAVRRRMRSKLVLAQTRYGEVVLQPMAATAMLLLVAAAVAASASVPVIFLGLVIWALRTPKHALEALTLSWLIGYLNHEVVALSPTASLLRWLILAASFGRVMLSYVFADRPLPKEIIYLSFFSGVVAVLALINSYAPVISVLKVASFTVGATTVLLGFRLAAVRKSYWLSWFATLFAVVLVLSIGAYLLGIGFAVSALLFQGVLNHPQAFGIFLALFLAWLTGMHLGEEASGRLPLLLLLGYAMLFASQSRTAVLALLIGLGGAIVFGQARRAFLATLFGRVGRMAVAGLLVLGILLLPTVQQAVRSFIIKYENDRTFSERFEASRGNLIQRSIENFKARPLTGIGFGVASNQAAFDVQADNALGIPLSAPIEKGFMPSALLEEVGLVGTFFFLMFLFVLARPVTRAGSLSALWLFMSCLAINFGEMVFFSFGGMGLIAWLLLGLSVTLCSEEPERALLPNAI